VKVLIALDESPVSARAARVAVRLFGTSDAVEFLVINVAALPAPWVAGAGFGAIAPLAMDPRWRAPAPDDDLTGDAEQLVLMSEAAGVPDPDVFVAAGDPVTEVCAAAEAHDVDVIVVGSHDKSALRRVIDPSVAAGVVRSTYRPVLVVSGTPPAPE
jgi:nucleotide-binding universal stress UspA family protein